MNLTVEQKTFIITRTVTALDNITEERQITQFYSELCVINDADQILAASMLQLVQDFCNTFNLTLAER